MENPNENDSLFQLQPAIDALEQLWRSTWLTTAQLTTTYFDRLRYINERLFDVAAQMPGRSIWSDIEAARTGAEEEIEDTAKEAVEKASSYPVPMPENSKKQRRSSAGVH